MLPRPSFNRSSSIAPAESNPTSPRCHAARSAAPLLLALLFIGPQAAAVPLANARLGSEIYLTALDPLTPALGGSVLATASTAWQDLAHDGQDYYGLRADGMVFQHPDGLGGSETFVFTIASTGWTGLAHDGQNFLGLASDGSVYKNPGGLGGVEELVVTIGFSGYDGLAHDGTQYFGLFSDDSLHANPGGLGGTQVLVGVMPAGTEAIALPVVTRPTARLVGAAPDRFDDYGIAVGLSGAAAIVGAQSDDANGNLSGSAYFYRFDGSSWLAEGNVLASDGASSDRFGNSVSISGDTAFVGAYLNSDNGFGTGSVYVFGYDGSGWVEDQKLLASDADDDNQFGRSISVSGDVAIVGADGNDDNGSDSGSAYIFRRQGSSWIEEQKLTASDAVAGDDFGRAVAVSGSTALIGARGGSTPGAVYVFRFDGSTWVEEQVLAAPIVETRNGFGAFVAISGNAAIVSALGDNETADDAGAAYVYRFDGSSWVEEQKLLASDGEEDDVFGRSVGLVGDTAIVGAWWSEGYYGRSGSAYIYRFDGSSWIEEPRLVASDDEFSAVFGISAAISEEYAIVGALGSTFDEPVGVGSAHIFTIDSPCGDGVLDPGEACDDGGVIPGDGCSASCELELCANGIDDDGDGLTDFAGNDPGCWGAGDLSEHSDFLPCDNGFDDDGDGATDYDPATAASPGDENNLPAGSGDPACLTADFPREVSRCQDGIDNDGDGLRDYDGGLSVLGPGHPDLTPPDDLCVGSPERHAESQGCGLGGEVALLLAPLLGLRRRNRPGDVAR